MSLSSPWATRSLAALVIVLLLIPLLSTLTQWTLNFDPQTLGLSFWLLCFKALFFTLLQSGMSASLACLLGGMIALGLIGWHGAVFCRCIERLCNLMGQFCFVLPGISVALIVIELNSLTKVLPSFGFWAIVWAHLILNVLFFASQCHQRLLAWLNTHGNEQCMAAQCMGLRYWEALRRLGLPIVLAELRSWWPLIFLWSLNAFSTVLILGGDPKFSTPEVLLFYFVNNDFTPARLAVLVILQIIVAFASAQLSFSKKWLRSTSNFTLKNRAVSSKDQAVVRPCTPRRFKDTAYFTVAVSLVTFFSFVVVWPIMLGFFELPQAWPNSLFLNATGNSVLIGIVSSLFSMLFLGLLFLSSGSGRRFAFFVSGSMPPTLIASAVVGSGLDNLIFQFSSPFQIVFCSLVISLSLLGVCSLWVENRMAEFSADLQFSAALAGAKPFNQLRYILLPLNADLFSRVLRLTFLVGIGDIAVSTLLLRDLNTAAALVRQFASRYDFSMSSWMLLFMAVSTIAISLLTQRRGATNNV